MMVEPTRIDSVLYVTCKAGEEAHGLASRTSRWLPWGGLVLRGQALLLHVVTCPKSSESAHQPSILQLDGVGAEWAEGGSNRGSNRLRGAGMCKQFISQQAIQAFVAILFLCENSCTTREAA